MTFFSQDQMMKNATVSTDKIIYKRLLAGIYFKSYCLKIVIQAFLKIRIKLNNVIMQMEDNFNNKETLMKMECC